jgi:hypothetical protein
MATDGLRMLESQLGARPPEGLTRLSQPQLRELATALSGARRRQAAELKAAGDKALGHIPWLLRGPVRKVLG